MRVHTIEEFYRAHGYDYNRLVERFGLGFPGVSASADFHKNFRAAKILKRPAGGRPGLQAAGYRRTRASAASASSATPKPLPPEFRRMLQSGRKRGR
ncbi:MAG: hypothetical protein QXO51_02820 [Halobacteria archaeon]